MTEFQQQRRSTARTESTEPPVEAVTSDRTVVDDAEAVLDEIETVLAETDASAMGDDLLMTTAATEKVQRVRRSGSMGARAWTSFGNVD